MASPTLKKTSSKVSKATDQVTWSRFNEKKFSDVAIKFGDRCVFAHKVILCRGSEYFSRMFDSFQEATQSEVTLHDDDPDAVTSMLHHLYGIGNSAAKEPPSLATGILADIQLCVTADKYLVKGLQRKARQKIRSALKDWTNRESLIFFELYAPMRNAFEGVTAVDDEIRGFFRSFCVRNIRDLRASSKFTEVLKDIPELCLSLVLESEDEKWDSISVWRCGECEAAITKVTVADRSVPLGQCLCGEEWPRVDEVEDSEFVEFVKKPRVVA